MKTIFIILLCCYACVIYLMTPIVFLSTDGGAVKSTWDLFFENSKRWSWAYISSEERTFIAFFAWMTAPILWPSILLIALCSFLLESVRGFRKVLFRFRSRHFDELKDKIIVEENN